MTILFIQPYFDSPGHPAEEFRAIVETMNSYCRIKYVAYYTKPISYGHAAIGESLRAIVTVFFKTAFFRSPRLRMVEVMLRLVREFKHHDVCFLLDAHLPVFLLLYKLLWIGKKNNKLLVGYLVGPEKVLRNPIARWLLLSAISRNVHICVRTERLKYDWDKAVGERLKARILLWNHVENFDDTRACQQDKRYRFGILGQIRRGKSIELIVPRDIAQRKNLQVIIAGEYANETAYREYHYLDDYSGMRRGYLSTEKYRELCALLEYQLLLYDEWDNRMESGNIFVSVLVGTPVIVYDGGWLSDIVMKFNIGVVVQRNEKTLASILGALPVSRSQEYKEYVKGMDAFRQYYGREKSIKMMANLLYNQ